MSPPETYAYATRDDSDLLLDVYRPDGTPKAAVLILHGGGWREGSKETVAPSAEALAGAGFVALPVEYRLLGRAPWPAQIQDVKSAIRWARRNCRSLGVDPGKVALEGFSAGAHLALLAAGTSDIDAYSDPVDAHEDCSVAAVVAFFPPIELRIGAAGQAGVTEANRLLQDKTSANEAGLASPINHVKPGFAPTCLLHGAADHIVAAVASQRLFERLSEVGTSVDMHLFAGHTHAFASLPSMLVQVQAIAASFLERHVVDPHFYIEENLRLNRFAGGGRPEPRRV